MLIGKLVNGKYTSMINCVESRYSGIKSHQVSINSMKIPWVLNLLIKIRILLAIDNSIIYNKMTIALIQAVNANISYFRKTTLWTWWKALWYQIKGIAGTRNEAEKSKSSTLSCKVFDMSNYQTRHTILNLKAHQSI